MTKPGITGGRNFSTLWMSVSPRLFSHLGEVTAHGCLKSLYRESAVGMHSINLPRHLVTSSSTNTTETSLLTSLGWQKKLFFIRSTPSTQKTFGKHVRFCTNHLVPVFLSYQVMAKLHGPVWRRLSSSTHSLPPVLTHPFLPLIHLMTPSQYASHVNCKLSTVNFAKSL